MAAYTKLNLKQDVEDQAPNFGLSPQLEARRARGDVPVVAPGAMPSSYRENKARAKEWEQAVVEGREEQLRIENWMKAEKHLAGLPERKKAER